MLDRPLRPNGILPGSIRASGGVRVRFERAGQRTVRTEVAESGGFRVRFPRGAGAACEAVLINTGGGMTGSDRLLTQIEVADAAEAVVTTQAAEKIYRSQGPDTVVNTALSVGAGAILHWLPQETILFDRSRLKRSLAIELAADARLIACESVYFGRSAMGEVLAEGQLRDRWRVRRAGRLVFAEDVRLSGDIDGLLQRPALGAGARAVAMVLVAAPDVAERLEPAREAMAGATAEWGLGVLDGLLLGRLIAPDAAALRADLARLMTHLTASALPRSWQT